MNELQSFVRCKSGCGCNSSDVCAQVHDSPRLQQLSRMNLHILILRYTISGGIEVIDFGPDCVDSGGEFLVLLVWRCTWSAECGGRDSTPGFS